MLDTQRQTFQCFYSNNSTGELPKSIRQVTPVYNAKFPYVQQSLVNIAGIMMGLSLHE